MKRVFFVLLALIPFLTQAQSKLKTRKYPSLLWEITGNGLKKPSYLFGTMHVSSKIAFNLADSFYLGIRNADVVALETNPESWQEDMSKYEFDDRGTKPYGRYGGYLSVPNDYLSINTLRFYKYDKKIERSLYSSPSTINNLLYRSYGNESADFEEDTYLDMYIYQCGKKWGKKVAGVERYAESMKLMQEAYKDASREKMRARSFDIDDEFSSNKLQEAYRKGNLDQLDSINKLNSFSEAFDEKFLYKRNDIQAESIDSILKTNLSLFVGVGAAHLPGTRGVIEILRNKGYKLRPIMMNERDSRHKDEVEKVRVPVTFHKETSPDGFYKVDIPGKFYESGDDGALEQRQYADMANGSYYMVTRIMTNAWLWGHDADDVYRKIDSLLYENVPGKLINKTRIIKNGYPGFDILNKTRRGDLQRYNIFITPFEVIFFKISGTGDYVKEGTEADRFFNSIVLREYNTGSNSGFNQWPVFSPHFGGFSVRLPHDPYIGNDGSWIYDAHDKTGRNFYRIVRTDIHNYHFAEEDTFDLGLLDESFAASEFIDKRLSRKHFTYKGYPALDCKYRDKSGSIYLTRFIIQGPHYYTLVAHGRKENTNMLSFLNSFEIKPLVYPASKSQQDTSLYFNVISPLVDQNKKEKLSLPRTNLFGADDEELSEKDLLESGTYRSKLLSNDTTGEKIFISFYKSPRYYYRKDSIKSDLEVSLMGDTSWIVRTNRKFELPNKIKVTELMVTDTGSSRLIWNRRYEKNGIGFSIVTLIDTLTPPSAFIKSFFETFNPTDTLEGINPYTKKSDIFFRDFMSKDSSAHKRAVRNIQLIELDSTDLNPLIHAIQHISFSEKDYLETKKALVGKLGDINSNGSADFLKKIYYSAGDTIELQYAALEALLTHQNQYAFNHFRDIITNEPPVLEKGNINDWDYSNKFRSMGRNKMYDYNNGGFLDELYDSLALTRTILPDLLPLLNLEDYKVPMMNLISKMIDSSLVNARDYEFYFSKFFIEAKQELKKQVIAEKRRAIARAEEGKSDKIPSSYLREPTSLDKGNEQLSMYATLLLPFWETNPTIAPWINQLLKTNDNQLKYNTFLLLLRNKKPYPDSLLNYFAKFDEFRYYLYRDLKDLKKTELFPSTYNNHVALGKSKLFVKRSYDRPDTIAFISKLPAVLQGKKGHVYFYKYKSRPTDQSWKLASVGLVPDNAREFEFDDQYFTSDETPGWQVDKSDNLNLTSLTETRITDEEPINSQLNKALKKILYSRRKSAKEFYGTRETNPYEVLNRLLIRD